MLRRMCKECVRCNFWIFYDKKLTGEVSDRRRQGGYTITTLTCRECGHTWTYKRKRRATK